MPDGGIQSTFFTAHQADAKMVDCSEQQPTVISIDKDGRYYINSVDQENTNITNGEQLPLSRIAGRVRARLEVFPAMQVFVRGDRDVAYGSVVNLMAFLKNNGVEKVGIITESPGN